MKSAPTAGNTAQPSQSRSVADTRPAGGASPGTSGGDSGNKSEHKERKTEGKSGGGAAAYSAPTLDRRTMTDEQLIAYRINAAKNDDVRTIKRCKGLGDWYSNVDINTGNTLLHFAVMSQSKAVFDYLISECFPLNHKNYEGETVLDISLRMHTKECEYFSCVLITDGADIDAPVFKRWDETLVHYVIRYRNFALAKLLIEKKGYDMNARNGDGLTPLLLSLHSFSRSRRYSREMEEFATALLCCGADAWLGRAGNYNAFEVAVKSASPDFQNLIFAFMIDDYSLLDTHIEILLDLANEGSPLFGRVLERTAKIIVAESHEPHYFELFNVGPYYLKSLAEKDLRAIKKILSKVEAPSASSFNLREDEPDILHFMTNVISLMLSGSISHKILQVFLEVFPCLHEILAEDLLKNLPRPEEALERLCLMALTDVSGLDGRYLLKFYRHYGFNELVKVALHVGVRPIFPNTYDDSYFQVLFDVNFDLEKILNEPYRANRRLDKLLPYFANAKLLSFYQRDRTYTSNHPKVPLLLELARNAFRKFLVQKFSIKSAAQLYYYIHQLDIARPLKQIIRFEARLY